jgi:hypothetical protein
MIGTKMIASATTYKLRPAYCPARDGAVKDHFSAIQHQQEQVAGRHGPHLGTDLVGDPAGEQTGQQQDEADDRPTEVDVRLLDELRPLVHARLGDGQGERLVGVLVLLLLLLLRLERIAHRRTSSEMEKDRERT